MQDPLHASLMSANCNQRAVVDLINSGRISVALSSRAGREHEMHRPIEPIVGPEFVIAGFTEPAAVYVVNVAVIGIARPE